MREKITLDKRIRDKKERDNYERNEGKKHEQEPPIEFNRFEKIPGGIKSALLQLISSEYWKSEDKKESEGTPFAEQTFENLRKRLLEENQKEIKQFPTVLATIMKDPAIRGLIDPDRATAIDALSNPERNTMTKAYQEKMTEIVTEQMEKGKPFLHMLISERRKGADDTIVLAGGMRNGKLPSSPQVLRWFAGKLQKKIAENNLVVDGKPVKVKINIEGKPICGARVHVERRDALGGMYQFIKGKVPAGLLAGDNSNKVVDAFAEMAQEFQEQFPDASSLEEYLYDNKTLEDEDRKEGWLHIKFITSDEIEKGTIGLSKNLRQALGTSPGDKVRIDAEEFTVVQARRVDGKISRVPQFNPKDNFEKTGKDGSLVVIGKVKDKN